MLMPPQEQIFTQELHDNISVTQWQSLILYNNYYSLWFILFIYRIAKLGGHYFVIIIA